MAGRKCSIMYYIVWRRTHPNGIHNRFAVGGISRQSRKQNNNQKKSVTEKTQQQPTRRHPCDLNSLTFHLNEDTHTEQYRYSNSTSHIHIIDIHPTESNFVALNLVSDRINQSSSTRSSARTYSNCVFCGIFFLFIFVFSFFSCALPQNTCGMNEFWLTLTRQVVEHPLDFRHRKRPEQRALWSVKVITATAMVLLANTSNRRRRTRAPSRTHIL